ncbi:MAG: N-acetyl-glucosamine-6-phosphate deacetylase [Trizodia sp. TS-e1964]|nr:MAG: N-acetyl-glucosamine-6-phosphate deacetylase [Trizodia sp. TS-e1964]
MFFHLALFPVVASLVTALWPAPETLSHGSDVLWVKSDLKITQTQTYSIGLNKDRQIIQGAIGRAHKQIFTDNYVPWKSHPRNSDFEPQENSTKKYITSLLIDLTAKNSSTAKPLAQDFDESYRLEITSDGRSTITAPSTSGVLHALNSFTQLFYEHSKPGVGVYTNLAPILITDKPKFAYRGLNLDIARNFYGIDDIKRTIDAISTNKFNHLHLHATDSQSWPLEIPALPGLAEKGAYQKGLSYSPKDLEDIQEYAAARCISTIIEIDMPGHTSSIGYAFPDLIAAFNIQPNWDTYAAEPPSGSLKLNSPAVGAFLAKLFDDLLPRIKPYSAYFHTGGDEVNPNPYLLDETVKSNDAAVIRPFLQKFVDRNHNQVRKHGLTPIVWEEMLLQWNLTLGMDTVIQTWQGDQAVKDTVSKGYRALVGNFQFWYLDCGRGQWLDFLNGASFQKFYPFQDYCSPTKNWRLIYSYDPTAGLTPEEASLVIGGEVHMWSEQTDPINLDSTLWPRASAAGEVLWSGRRDVNGNNRSQTDASPRLSDLRERMVRRGIRAGPVQMTFCTQGNGTQCSL